MPFDQLPEELLLQVAFHLPDSTAPKHLKNLCLTSRMLRPIAQEALHTTAKLTISCGCHPRVNAVLRLLRTLLDRPDLASKVKVLRFRAVRKCIQALYFEQAFESNELRDRCVAKLKELGYSSKHPWQRSITNHIESAFGGLLLTILPNLTELDFWIKDHQRGPPSSEIISGLWGSTIPPDAVMQGWKNISHLVTGDTSMLKCGIEFDKLTSLDLRTISIGTVLRLNGPGSLQGAENLQDLALTVSIQFADRPLVEKAEIEFSELLNAIACRALKNLRILFINDGYHIGDDLTTELNASYFLDQLHSVQETLETLSITLETSEDDGELEWLVDMCQHPTTSLKKFTALKSLVIPQPFIFTARSASWNTVDNCQPNALPPNLEEMELLYPHEDVEEWAEGFLDQHYWPTSSDPFPSLPIGRERHSNFRKLILTCREDVGIGAGFFTDQVDKIWWTLSAEYGIETEVHDQMRDTRENPARLYEDQGPSDEDHEVEDEEIDDDGFDGKAYLDGGNIFSHGQDPLEAQRMSMSEALQSQTDILEFIRDVDGADGMTLARLCDDLEISWKVATDAVEDLLMHGNIRLVGNFPDRQYQFVTESANLRIRDSKEGGREARNPEGGSETDDSMPELEAYDADTMDDASGNTTGIGSHVPPSVFISPTSVLRCLRDIPDRSIGLDAEGIGRLLDSDDYIEIRAAVRELLRDGHVTFGSGAKVYFWNENEELRAEDMD